MRSKFKWIFTLLVALTVQLSFAQGKTVTGTVSDASGPLPGANVLVKETKVGVQTDIDGKYAIQVQQGQTLVFSFVGMADREVKVGASSTVNVSLSAGVQLSEVVVTGAVGIRRRKEAETYSAQVVQAREITQAANPNAVQALTGKVTGLQINTTNSSVNATLRVTLRGPKSFTADPNALIVIDDVISSANILQALAPDQIESVNVIKGAQGAAIYGSQGVNGVLIVTTKKGARGKKMVVGLTSSVDFSEVAYLPQRQTRYGQGWDGVHYSYENGTWGPEFDGSLIPTGLPQADGTYALLPYKSRGSDNIKDFFRTGRLMQNGVTLSSGDENGYVFFSANNLENQFIIEKDVLKRNAFQFKAGKKVGKWSFDGNVNYITAHTMTTSNSLYYDLLQTATNIDINRYRNAGNEHSYSYYVRNPWWVVDNVRNDSRQDYFTGIAKIKYDINSHINVAYNANVNFLQTRALSYTNAYTDPYDVLGGTQSIRSAFSTSNNQARNLYGDLTLNFDYDLFTDLNMKLLVGQNFQDFQNSITSVGGNDLSIPGLYNIDNVSSLVAGTNSFARRRFYAYFGNLDVNYKEYLYLNATFRYETYSGLPRNADDYLYPSVGVSFVPTKAFSALRDKKGLSYLKLSANYTSVGGPGPIGAYSINRTYQQATGYPFDGSNSYIPNLQTTLANATLYDPNIKPEFYNTFEVNANFRFLDDRISLDASYYKSINKDLITATSASAASGMTTFVTNIGQTTTDGYELELGVTPFRAKNPGDFNWDFRVGLTHYKTVADEITPFSDEAEIYSPYGGYGVFAVKGQEYPLLKGFGYQRDDQNRVIIDPQTGLPKVTTELITLGKATPDYILNFNTSFSFKGFTLSGTFDYRTGHQYYSGTKQTLAQFGYLVDTAQNGRTGFIMPNSSIPNGDGTYSANTSVVTGGPNAVAYQQYITSQYADNPENFVLDATAFKCRELALSYAVPSKVLEKTGINAIRLGIYARNPFTVLPKENRGYDDPETSISNGNIVGLASGTSLSGNAQYPNLRSYGFNVNLNF